MGASEAAWLDPKTEDTGALLALLKQYPADEMEFYPVSRGVNSPAVDFPGILRGWGRLRRSAVTDRRYSGHNDGRLAARPTRRN
jgi:hypothetical protein